MMSQRDEGGPKGSEKQQEIDAILDAALDDLDDDDDEPPSSGEAMSEASTKRGVPDSEEETLADVGGLNDMLKQLFEGNAGDADDDAFGAMMQEMQKHIQTEIHAQHPESGTDVDRTISKLMEDMASMGNAEDDDPTGDPRTMQEMMKEFEKMGGDFNADDMIDGMMGQLLSKDLMYEPMKQVTELFPEWLQENKSKLSEEDYSNRCKQHDCFRKLIHLYETQPDNVETLMMVMQETQEFGQPPAEIVKKIAPGLDLDDDGVPKMDLLNGSEECRIM